MDLAASQIEMPYQDTANLVASLRMTELSNDSMSSLGTQRCWQCPDGLYASPDREVATCKVHVLPDKLTCLVLTLDLASRFARVVLDFVAGL